MHECCTGSIRRQPARPPSAEQFKTKPNNVHTTNRNENFPFQQMFINWHVNILTKT